MDKQNSKNYMIQLHEILTVVTLIIQIQNGQEIGTATGFFYQNGNC